MSITLTKEKSAYLEAVAAGLSDLSEEDRDEVIQDLEAHLSELGDDELTRVLGDPGAFVAEFRSSAGLVSPQRKRRFAGLRRVRARMEQRSARLAERVQWERFRPAWIWTRGWLLVAVVGLLYDNDPIERFPLPQIGNSTLTGLVLTGIATSLSVWLDAGRPGSRREGGSKLFSVVASAAVLASLANPVYLPANQDVGDPGLYIDRLTSAHGEPVENIYAYDLEGNPVEVLLFDAQGRPLQVLPDHVYEQATYDPGQRSFDFGYGMVTFERDRFGRIIPNLYPLQLSTYDDYGRLVDMPPPSLGFPSLDEDTSSGADENVPTSIARVGGQ